MQGASKLHDCVILNRFCKYFGHFFKILLSPEVTFPIFQIVKSLKTLSFTTLAAMAAVTPANAYFRAGFKITKEYRQKTASAPVFVGGEAYLYVVDGSVTRSSSCYFNGSENIFGIASNFGCNIGANAVEVDGLIPATPLPNPASCPNGLINTGTYDQEFSEVVGIEEATLIEPGYPHLVKMIARPTQDFPLNSVNSIVGVPTSIFYDLQSVTGDVREYRLAGTGNVFVRVGCYWAQSAHFVPGYSWRKAYVSRSTMEKEIVQGTYQFSFPTRGYPSSPRYLSFPVTNSVEGYVTKPIKGGFRFTNVPSYNGGFAEYDPRVTNEFKWEGLVASLIGPSDRLYIGFRRMVNENDPDDLGAVNAIANPDGTVGQPIYNFPPPGADPDAFPGTRIRLVSPVQSSYTLPPGFFDANPATPNLRGATLMEVTLERDPLIGLSSVSSRKFVLPIKFVNTFPGAMAAAFPEDTPASLMAKDADPDGDGITNWVEWLSGSNPNEANAPKTLSALSFVPPSAAKSGEPGEGYYQLTFDRPADLRGGSVSIEMSGDLVTWATVPTDDSNPIWKTIDDPAEPQIRVISKTKDLTDKKYFRAKLTN